MPCATCGLPKLDCNCSKKFTRKEFYKLLDAVNLYSVLVLEKLPEDFKTPNHAAFYYNRRNTQAGHRVKMHTVESGWLFVRTQ